MNMFKSNHYVLRRIYGSVEGSVNCFQNNAKKNTKKPCRMDAKCHRIALFGGPLIRFQENLNHLTATKLEITPKPKRITHSVPIRPRPPPKWIVWCKASIAQAVGKTCATVLKVSGTISSGHQQRSKVAMIRLINTHNPGTLSDLPITPHLWGIPYNRSIQMSARCHSRVHLRHSGLQFRLFEEKSITSKRSFIASSYH